MPWLAYDRCISLIGSGDNLAVGQNSQSNLITQSNRHTQSKEGCSMRAATRSVTILAPVGKVFTFVSEPANLPLWSKSFCLSIRQDQGQWVAETPQGPIRV